MRNDPIVFRPYRVLEKCRTNFAPPTTLVNVISTYFFSWEPAFMLDSDIIKIDPTIPEVSQISTKRDIEKHELISQFLKTCRRTFYPASLSSQNCTQ